MPQVTPRTLETFSQRQKRTTLARLAEAADTFTRRAAQVVACRKQRAPLPGCKCTVIGEGCAGILRWLMRPRLLYVGTAESIRKKLLSSMLLLGLRGAQQPRFVIIANSNDRMVRRSSVCLHTAAWPQGSPEKLPHGPLREGRSQHTIDQNTLLCAGLNNRTEVQAALGVA